MNSTPSTEIRNRVRVGTLCLWILIAGSANSSEIVADSININQISAQPAAPGLQFISSAVSSSSITLQGPDGHIIAESSITASAFFGDGSHLSEIATAIATQVFSGAQTFLSTFTAQTSGNQIQLSTGSSTVNLRIQSDGTTTFYPELHNSSSTTIPRATTTASTFGPCVAGSTLTITTSGGTVELTFSGIMRNTALNSTVALTFLADGQFPSDLSSTKGLTRSHDTIPHGAYDAGPFRYLLDAPAAGAHSYCLSISAPAGGTTALGELEFDFRSFFLVKELK